VPVGTPEQVEPRPQQEQGDSWEDQLVPVDQTTQPPQTTTQLDSSPVNSELTDDPLESIVRPYLVDRFGVEWNTRSREELEEAFMLHQRSVETNEVSTFGEAGFIARADDARRSRAAAAYKYYESKPNILFNKDVTWGETGEGLKDYAYSLVTAPSTYAGLIIGSLLGKAGTVGGAQAVRVGAKIAATRAASAISTKGLQGTALAAARTAKQVASKEAARQYIRNATTINLLVGRVAAPKIGTAARVGIAGGVEAGVAVVQDKVLQDNVKMRSGAQEEYSYLQTALTGALGFVGGGLDQLLIKTNPKFKAGNMVTYILGTPGNQAAVAKQAATSAAAKIIAPLGDWQAMKTAGQAQLGVNFLMEKDILGKMLLGDAGQDNGIVHAMAKMGVDIDPDRRYTEQVASYLQNLPKPAKQILDGAFGQYGLTTDEFADQMVASSSQSGSLNAILSEASKVHGAHVFGNQLALNGLNSKLVKQAKEVTTSDYTKYFQDTWRKSIVSTISTSGLNFAGSGTYFIGDVMNNYLQAFAYGVTGREKEAAAYTQIATRQIGRLLNSFGSTRQNYEALLFIDPNSFKNIRYLTANGLDNAGTIDKLMKKYNFDLAGKPTQTAVKITEKGLDIVDTLAAVSLQDTFWKSNFLFTELDKVSFEKFGMSIDDLIVSGRYKELTPNDKGKALHETLKATFSADYTPRNKEFHEVNSLISGVFEGMEKISNSPGGGFLLPFAKFANNSLMNVYRFTPIQTAYDIVAYSYSKTLGDGTRRAPRLKDAVSATIGATAVVALTAYRMENPDTPWNSVEMNGSVLDISNNYPLSYMMAVAEGFKRLEMGQQITPDLIKALGDQVGINAFVEAFNMNGLTDALGESLNHSEFGFLGGVGAYLGAIASGFTRPLDIYNKLAGIYMMEDSKVDRKLAKGISENFTVNATRYTDKIFNMFEAALNGVPITETEALQQFSEEKIRGKEARIATRQGDVPITDDIGLFATTGSQTSGAKTYAEKAFEMANMPSWMGSLYSDSPEYNRIANEIIGPDLERYSKMLVNWDEYINGDDKVRRTMLKSLLRNLRAHTNDVINGKSQDTLLVGTQKELFQMKKAHPDAYYKAVEELGLEETNPRGLGFEESLKLKLTIQGILKRYEVGP
jgi:hypothetical protein